MAPPQPRLRPFTFFGRVPKGVNSTDICKELVKRFTRAEIGGVQDFQAGRFEICLKNKKVVQAFLADPVITVKGTAVRFAYRGKLSTTVRVFGFPNDLDVRELREALERYGPVESITTEFVPEFEGIPSGNRRVRMDLRRPLPNFLQVAEFTLQCEYEGVARVCRRCGASGHVRAACDVPLCARCGAFGHASCTLPCPQCGADHALIKCGARTFASVAKHAMVVAAAAAAVPQPTQPAAKEPTDALSSEQPPEGTEDYEETTDTPVAVSDVSLTASELSSQAVQNRLAPRSDHAHSGPADSIDQQAPPLAESLEHVAVTQQAGDQLESQTSGSLVQSDDEEFTPVTRRKRGRPLPRIRHRTPSASSSATSGAATQAKRRNERSPSPLYATEGVIVAPCVLCGGAFPGQCDCVELSSSSEEGADAP